MSRTWRWFAAPSRPGKFGRSITSHSELASWPSPTATSRHSSAREAPRPLAQRCGTSPPRGRSESASTPQPEHATEVSVAMFSRFRRSESASTRVSRRTLRPDVEGMETRELLSTIHHLDHAQHTTISVAGQTSSHHASTTQSSSRLTIHSSSLHYAGRDLSGQNLAGQNFAHADFAGANLSNANLSGANLSGANLSGANLTGANLSGANLGIPGRIVWVGYVSLHGGNSSLRPYSYPDHSRRATSLNHADLTNANLTNANLDFADLSLADLSGAVLEDAILVGAHLGSNFNGANLTRTNLTDAKLGGANLWNAMLINTNFAGVELRGVNLDGVNFSNVDNLQRWQVSAHQELTNHTISVLYSDFGHPHYGMGIGNNNRVIFNPRYSGVVNHR